MALKSLKDSEISQQQLIVQKSHTFPEIFPSCDPVKSDPDLTYFHLLTKALNSTCFSFNTITKQSLIEGHIFSPTYEK